MEVLDKILEVKSEEKPLIEEIKTFYKENFKLIELYSKNISGELLLEVYQYFVKHFEEKINPFCLCKIIISITSNLKDQQRAIEFVEQIIVRIEKNKKKVIPGTIVLRCEKSMCLLRNVPLAKVELQEEKIKEILDEAVELIKKEGYVDPYVNSYYYKTLSKFYEITFQYNEFYSNALLFLSYSNLKEMSPKEKEYYAYHVGIAALVGDEIYNFGELLANPVIEFLQKSKVNSWLFDMLVLYNKGDITGYKGLEKENAEKMNKTILKKNKNFLERKIQLMAILELVFGKEVEERNISFEEIAKCCHCKYENVEYVLLKALGSGLMEGVIDQVSKTVYIKWIQPRVLDKSQIAKMRNKITNWFDTVKRVQKAVRE